MIIVLGYASGNVDEVPVVLYVGDDGDTAERVMATTLMPRVGWMRNPTVQMVRHWTEEGQAAWEDGLRRATSEADVMGLVRIHAAPDGPRSVMPKVVASEAARLRAENPLLVVDEDGPRLLPTLPGLTEPGEEPMQVVHPARHSNKK